MMNLKQVQDEVKLKLFNLAEKNNFVSSQKIWDNGVDRKIYAMKSWKGNIVKLYGEVYTGHGLKLHTSRGAVVCWRSEAWILTKKGLAEIDRFVEGILNDDGILSVYK